jgi:type IV secretion system protein TrbL
MRLLWSNNRLSSFVFTGQARADGGVLSTQSLLKRFAIIVLGLLLMSSVLSLADDAQVINDNAANSAPIIAQTGAAGYNGSRALHDTAVAVEKQLTALAKDSGLKELGMYLVGFFFFANLVWIALKGFASHGGFFTGFLSDLIPLFIATGVTVLFLNEGVGQLIINSLNMIAGKIAGMGTKENASVAALINEAAVTTIDTLGNVWSIGGTSIKISWDVLGMVESAILRVIAMGLTAFFLIVALCIYIATLVTSQVTVFIALILAPMFVPFLMFKPAIFMFEGWLRFVIGAGMMKIVGLLLLQVTNVIMATMVGVSKHAAVVAGAGDQALSTDIVLYATMILLAGLATMLMAQTSSIATGIISGSAGGAGFAGWTNLTGRSMSARAAQGALVGGGGGGGRGAPGASGGGSRGAPGAIGASGASSGPGASGGPRGGGAGGGRPLSGGALGVGQAAARVASYAAGRGVGVGVQASQRIGAARLAKSDARAANLSLTSEGSGEIKRDTSTMSAAGRQQYERSIPRALADTEKNRANVAAWNATEKVGPPPPPPVSFREIAGQKTQSSGNTRGSGRAHEAPLSPIAFPSSANPRAQQTPSRGNTGSQETSSDGDT